MTDEHDNEIEKDNPEPDFIDEAVSGGDEGEPTPTKPAGALKFLTFLMLLLGLGLFVMPFVWGIDGKKTEMIPDSSVLNASDWLWWLGDLHVLIIHLPIGVFVWVFALEVIGVLSFRKFKPHLGATLAFAAITAIIASVFGYFQFLRGDHGAAELAWDLENNRMGMHMWLSILFSFFVILTFISKLWCRHHQKGSPFYPFFLLLAAASLILSSHMGGGLVHSDMDLSLIHI